MQVITTQKIALIVLNIIFFVFKNVSKNFRYTFLKVKNSLLELEKDLIQMKDKELKGREVKI